MGTKEYFNGGHFGIRCMCFEICAKQILKGHVVKKFLLRINFLLEIRWSIHTSPWHCLFKQCFCPGEDSPITTMGVLVVPFSG